MIPTVQFSVGFSGTLPELYLLLSYAEYIESIYCAGISNILPGARNIYTRDVDTLVEIVEACHNNNIKLIVAVNGTCVGRFISDKITNNQIRAYIRLLETINVDRVVISDPVLMMRLREWSNIEIQVSSICAVDSIDRADYFKRLGVNQIVLDTEVNRSPELVRSIARHISPVTAILLVNEGCLPRCPLRQFHYNLLSHSEIKESPDWYYQECIRVRKEEPLHLITSPVIRPEDLHYFEKEVNVFKVAGRKPWNIARMTTRLEAYIKRAWNGNFLELLDAPNSLSKNLFIDNTKLNGVFEQQRSCLQRHECCLCRKCITFIGNQGCDVINSKHVEVN